MGEETTVESSLSRLGVARDKDAGGAGAAGNLKSGKPSEGVRGDVRDMLPMLGVLGTVAEPVRRPRRPVMLPLRSDDGKVELKRGDGWVEKGRDGLVAGAQLEYWYKRKVRVRTAVLT